MFTQWELIIKLICCLEESPVLWNIVFIDQDKDSNLIFYRLKFGELWFLFLFEFWFFEINMIQVEHFWSKTNGCPMRYDRRYFDSYSLNMVWIVWYLKSPIQVLTFCKYIKTSLYFSTKSHLFHQKRTNPWFFNLQNYSK